MKFLLCFTQGVYNTSGFFLKWFQESINRKLIDKSLCTFASSLLFADATMDTIISSEKYCSESKRLETFVNWPSRYVDKYCLAKTGMFYTQEDDKVACYFCKVEIGHWEEGDNAVGEHLRWSNNCPLLRRQLTNNIPINSEDLLNILPPVSYDICGNNNGIEIRPNAYPEGTISSHPVYEMEYPEYGNVSSRVRSFCGWPKNKTQTPEELAHAGFFYTGTEDKVICFSCGGCLKQWFPDDDPWEHHALFFSDCKFLKAKKDLGLVKSIVSKPNETTKVADQTNEKNLCAICYVNKFNMALVPCGHLICEKCASLVISCHICRSPFKDIIHVYY